MSLQETIKRRLRLCFLVGLIGNQILLASCEAKEFDWSDLGVSLTGPKSALTAGSGGAQNNLRILVSPQRRISKNYEFDYSTNGSQPIQNEASYVIPGSSGAYAGSGQSASAANHASAYSALSASLASLKNRLSARGVTLSGDPNSGGASVSGYSTGNGVSNAYTTNLLSGSQAEQQAQQQALGVGGQQPTYLSVSSAGQEPNLPGGYSLGGHNQSSDNNKTIVLAIPAKINFLTDGSLTGGNKQQASGQQQQQQLAVANSVGQQVQPLEYATGGPKQYALSQDQNASLEGQMMQAPVEQAGLMVEQQQQQQQQQQMQQPPQQQYVIVNSPPVGEQQYLAAAAAPGQQAYAPIYPTKLQPIKYIQHQQAPPAIAYQPAQPQQIQLPQVQKVYATGALPAEPSVEQAAEQHARYGSCLDTCNSADPRWRKQAVSKYKYCCSRSSEYDAQFDQPSPVKLSESAKTADDAYYSYLYRKSRARRSRRPHRSSSRYNRYYHGSSPAAASSDDEASNSQANSESSSEQAGTGGRSRYYEQYPSRHYKPRPAAYEPTEQAAPESTGKYLAKAYRKARGHTRDYSNESAGSGHEYAPSDSPTQEDEHHQQVYPPSVQVTGSNSPAASYGAGDYSVEAARYPISGPVAHSTIESRNPYSVEEDQEPARGYSDDAEPDQLAGKASMTDGQDNYQPEQLGGQQDDQAPADQPEAMTAPSSGYVKYRGPQQQQKYRKAYNNNNNNAKQTRKGRKHARKVSKVAKSHYSPSSSQSNGTDYESAQAGDYSEHNNNSDNEEQHQKGQEGAGSDGNGNSDNEKEVISNLANKYKTSLNDSTVANLSKTTMHLKEILSILEKKTHLKSYNETSNNQQSTTSTPVPPVTVTTNAYPLSSIFGSPYNTPDFLISDLSLKSPYRFESSSLGSPLAAAASALTYPTSFGSDSSFSSLAASSFGPSQSHFGLPTIKSPLSGLNGPGGLPHGHPHGQRKRRVNKNGVRYNSNGVMIPPKTSQALNGASHSQGAGGNSQSSLKNPYLNSYYPYWYTRTNSPSVTNAYPYRNLHKNPYTSLLTGPLTSKLAAAAAASAALYSDDSRFNTAASAYEQLANVASSLRPSTTMRLRSKPLVFQPHVLPIYTRHSILTQPLDVKK